jgi:site-specific recombinase XerD
MGEIPIRKALDDYITVYMPYRNFAERTRVEYQNDLEDLVGFLEKSVINYVKEIGIPIIERYVAHLEQEGFASLTRKRKVVAIRSFLSFLYQEGYIDTNIATKIVLPFAETTAPQVLTQTECNQIRSASANSPRDRAIIELVLQTGIRLSELIRLTLNDIEIGEGEETGEKQNGFMRILGSRAKKERVILLNIKACAALKNYLGIRTDAGNSILFLNRFGKPLGERGVQKMLRKYLERAGIGRASIHTLRHTFGFHQIANGTEPTTIQGIMGNKDPRSMSIYVSLARELLNRKLQDNAL